MTEIASIALPAPRPAPLDAGSAPVHAVAVVAEVSATAPAPSAEVALPEPPSRAEQKREALQAQIDRVLANADTSLRFRVDEESERVVVSVLDGRGDVILQVPNEAALEIARRLARTGALVEEKA